MTVPKKWFWITDKSSVAMKKKKRKKKVWISNAFVKKTGQKLSVFARIRHMSP